MCMHEVRGSRENLLSDYYPTCCSVDSRHFFFCFLSFFFFFFFFFLVVVLRDDGTGLRVNSTIVKSELLLVV